MGPTPAQRVVGNYYCAVSKSTRKRGDVDEGVGDHTEQPGAGVYGPAPYARSGQRGKRAHQQAKAFRCRDNGDDQGCF